MQGKHFVHAWKIIRAVQENCLEQICILAMYVQGQYNTSRLAPRFVFAGGWLVC